MPVVGRGHDHDLGLLLVEQFAVVPIPAGLVAGELRHALGRGGELARVDVGQPHDLAAAGGHRLAEDVSAPPAAAHQGGAEFAA
jgi:hypothetical protein